jgi:hypothetical protein
VIFHCKLDDPPALIVLGLAVKLLIDGNPGNVTTITTDAVTEPALLLAVIVYVVDVFGDTSLVPATSTRPMPWFILTDVAPVTFHNRVDVPSELIADGLLLNAMITGGVPAGVVGVVGWVGNVKQPGITISNNNSAKEKIPNFLILCTS